MYNFQTFGCSNESSPNSSCHFWNHKVRVYSNFASLFSVMKNNSSFCSQHLEYFGQKELIEKIFSDFSVVGWKFTKLLMSYLKPPISSSLNFASFFSAMRDNSSVSWNFIWFGQRQPIKVQTFRFLTAHMKSYQICTLTSSFCWKYIKFYLKNYRGFMSQDTEDWCKIRRKTDLFFQNVKNLVILSTWNSQNFHFDSVSSVQSM